MSVGGCAANDPLFGVGPLLSSKPVFAAFGGRQSVCVCVAQMCFVCVLVPFVRVMKKHNFRSSPSPCLPLTWLQPPCHWQQSPGLQCLKCTAVAACTAPYLPPPPTHSLYLLPLYHHPRVVLYALKIEFDSSATIRLTNVDYTSQPPSPLWQVNLIIYQ